MAEFAWDAAVETALRVRSAPDAFPNMKCVRGYARRALVSTAVRVRRREAARRAGFEEVYDLAAPVLPDNVKDFAEQVNIAVGALPDQLRRTLIAVKVAGHTASEFAAMEGIATQTVFNRISEALRALREALQGDEPS